MNKKGILSILIGPLVGYLVWAMFRLSFGVIIPTVMSEYGLIEAEGGALFSSSLGAMGVVMLIGGYLSDRIGKRIMMAIGFTFLSVGILAGGYSRGYSSLLFLMFIIGIGAGIFSSALHAFAGDIMPTSRGSLVGLTNSFYALGGFIGPWASAIIIMRLGWRSSFHLMGVIALIISIILWFGSRKDYHRKKDQEPKIAYRTLLKERSIILLCLCIISANFSFISFIVWAPSYLVKIAGLTLSDAGFSFGLYSLMGALGAVFFGFLSDKVGGRGSMMSSGIIASALPLLYFSAYVGPRNLIVLSGVIGFTAFTYWNLTISSAQNQVDVALIGSVTGLIQSVALITGVMAPIISGLMISNYGYNLALILSTTLPMLFYTILAGLKYTH